MTEILNKEFSRTAFLKSGGALVVGFSMLGISASRSATGATDPYASYGPADQSLIDSWIVIHADNTATVKTGKVELGQGTMTGLLMIAAEELDMSFGQMKHIINQDTNLTPNQGSTVGSQGIRNGGRDIRAAAAAARNALMDLAAKELGVAKSSLTVTNGVVSGGGRTVTYGALLGDKLFNVRIPSVPVGSTAASLGSGARSAGAPGTKPISQYKVVGKSGIQRVDIPDKVSGKFVYVHNVRVPGMLHGRIVRPRGQGAYGKGTAPKILSVDAGSIKNIPGARIVRYNDFLGVVAPTEYAAIQAAAQLKVTFADPPTLPSSGNMFKQFREQDSKGMSAQSYLRNTGNFDKAWSAAPVKVAQSYSYQYNGAMAMGPECCVAKVTPQGAHVFSNTQNVWSTRGLVRSALEQVMGTSAPPENRIRVTYYEGGSVYGGASPYDDVSQAAAVMSALAGNTVRLQFMRWDTHGWGNYGPPLLADLRGAVDANGKLTGLEFNAFVHAYYSTTPTFQAITGEAQFSSGAGQINSQMTGTAYDIPSNKVLRKTIPLEDNAFKMRHLRAPMAPQTAFAMEQMIDELAYAAKMDPVEFRFKNIASKTADPNQRWRHALETAVKSANWQPRVAASNLSSANEVTGRGVAFGFYAESPSAAVVDITVNKKTGKITVNEIFAGMDAGFVVYPDGLHNNELGGVVQGVSRALHEQVAFNRKGVTGLDWVSYPILRFADVPKIHLGVESRTDVPQSGTVAASGSASTGAGEPAVVPIPAAIANAFFDATGVRIRQAPMTPAKVRAVLRAAGR